MDDKQRQRMTMERHQCGAYLDVANDVIDSDEPQTRTDKVFILHTVALYRCVYNMYSIMLGEPLYGEDSISS